jgi:hypothetical protein
MVQVLKGDNTIVNVDVIAGCSILKVDYLITDSPIHKSVAQFCSMGHISRKPTSVSRETEKSC